MKKYKVYLFRSPECVRGWLAYIKTDSLTHRATYTVTIEAESGPKAKNKAITAINCMVAASSYLPSTGIKIIARNFADEIWGIDIFPEIKGI